MVEDVSVTDGKAWCDLMSKVLDLPVDEAYRPGVIENLAAIERHAALLASFALDDREESAAVYRA